MNKIYTKFVFFKAFHDESTVEVVFSFPAPLLAGFKTGLGARGKLARDDGLLRYVAGFFMRREYRAREKDRRSPGAREKPHPLRWRDAPSPLTERGTAQPGGEVLRALGVPSPAIGGVRPGLAINDRRAYRDTPLHFFSL